MSVYKTLVFLIIISQSFPSFSQECRDCYDFSYSHLELEFLLSEKKIKGFNELYFNKTCNVDTFIIDLFSNFTVDSVFVCNEKTNFIRKKNTIIIPNNFFQLSTFVIKIFYEGIPVSSTRPPWDSGFVWGKDYDNLDWVGVTCQMKGASLWWPNKDDLSDEPDSMRMNFIVPKPYLAISNGELIAIRDVQNSNDNLSRSFEWFVSSPINNYNVTVNIANYVNFTDTIIGKSGLLNLDYYILPQNLLLAKRHFHQVKPMLHFFEEKFGPYPFYKDGYCLVETSYLGMEHQSCIAYGNKFKKGYLGSFPGEIDFDFIIIHETAHEWWGNNLSMKNISDMWIHEAFATYAEALYVEKMYGYNDMLLYLNSQKKKINNKTPIITNNHISTDMYYKGSWMLHTLRTLLEDDNLWSNILRGLQMEFKHKTVDRYDIIQYIKKMTGSDFSDFFEQYLNQAELPVLEYFIKKNKKNYFLHFRWNAIQKFDMPVLAKISDENYSWIYPNTKWKKIKLRDMKNNDFKVAEDLFLLEVKRLK